MDACGLWAYHLAWAARMGRSVAEPQEEKLVIEDWNHSGEFFSEKCHDFLDSSSDVSCKDYLVKCFMSMASLSTMECIMHMAAAW